MTRDQTRKTAYIYTFFSVIVKTIPYFATLIYAHILPLDDIGALGALSTGTTLAALVFTAGCSVPLSILIHETPDTDRPSQLGAVLTMQLGLAALAFGIVFLISEIARSSMITEQRFPILMCIVLGLLSASALAPQTIARVQARAVRAGVMGALAAFLTSVGPLVAIALGARSQRPIVIGMTIGAFFGAALQITLVGYSAARLAIDWAFLRKLLAWGLPLAPASMAGWVINSGDRLLLATALPLKTLGIYSIGLTFAQAVQLIGDNVGLSWFNTHLKQLSGASIDEHSPVVSQAAWCISLTSIACLGTSLIGPIFVKLFLPSESALAGVVLVYQSVGFLFAVPYILVSYVLLARPSHRALPAALVLVAAAKVLVVGLLPRDLGLRHAAALFPAFNALLSVASIHIACRARSGLDWRRWAIPLSVAGAGAVASLTIPFYSWWAEFTWRPVTTALGAYLVFRHTTTAQNSTNDTPVKL